MGYRSDDLDSATLLAERKPAPTHQYRVYLTDGTATDWSEIRWLEQGWLAVGDHGGPTRFWYPPAQVVYVERVEA